MTNVVWVKRMFTLRSGDGLGSRSFASVNWVQVIVRKISVWWQYSLYIGPLVYENLNLNGVVGT